MSSHRSESFWKGLRWFAAEFLVVLAGVVAAFVVNAWWEHRHEAAEEREALRELDNALSADIQDLRNDMTAYSKQLRADSLLIASFDGIAPFSDSVADALATITVTRTHVANSAAFESLKSRGLGLISDDSLRLALVDFYAESTAGVALVNAASSEVVRTMLWPYYLTHIRVSPGRWQLARTVRENYPRLSRDSQFRLLLQHQEGVAAQTIQAYAASLREAQGLRSAVRSRLGNH